MFERIVQWNAEGREDTNFILGSTGEVLQGLGANESDIYMRSGEIEKTLQEHKEMTLEENKEALIKSSAVDGGSFSPNLRFEKLEIHKVFLRFPNLALTKNLSPSTLVDLIRPSLKIPARKYTFSSILPKQRNPNLIPIGSGFGFFVYRKDISY